MGIPFADLARLGRTFGSDDGAIWGGADSDSLLREPVEEQSSCLGMPTIEPEGELIKVIVEVLMLNTALVSAVQPSLEKRSCPVDSWQDLMRQLITTADDGDLMLVTGILQIRVATPSVGVHHGTGVTASLTKGMRLSPETSMMHRRRMRPMPRPFFSAATATMALDAVSRPFVPCSGPPT